MFASRTTTRIALAFAIAAAALTPSAAGAVDAASGSLTMTSEPNDYIGGGQSYAYTTEAGDQFNSSGSATVVSLAVNAANGHWWYLDFAAPSGQTLTVGNYPNATRYPFNQPFEPGLSVSGNGAGCNQLTGSFTVNEVAWGPNNHLERFDASFEQYCDGSMGALRGRIAVVNPPAPQPLSLGISIDAQGVVKRADGTASVTGVVTCNRPAQISVAGTLYQRASRFHVAQGSNFASINCGADPAPWSMVLTSGSVPFNPGKADMHMSANAFDAAYGIPVTVTQVSEIRLQP